VLGDFPTHQRMVRDLVVESEQQQCLLTIHDLLKLIIQLLSTKRIMLQNG
jgi:hypothetical protein